MNEFQKTTQTTTSNTPSADKAPFVITDLVLILVAIGILTFSSKPLSASSCWSIALLVISGAWIVTLPWLLEFRSKSSLSQLEGFKGVEDSLQKMSSFSSGINSALISLSNVQQVSEESAKRASAAEEKIAGYCKDFEERLSKATNYEKSTLQLEIEKSRRTEKEWIAVGIGILDHVLALSNAGIHSGKPEIAEQMKRFRGACLEIAAHAELTPYLPEPQEPFNPEKHLLPPNAPAPEPQTPITRVLAPGFIYQGIQVRKAMVLTENVEMTHASNPPHTEAVSPLATAQAQEKTFSTTSFVTETPAPEAAPEEPATPSFTPAEPLEEEPEPSDSVTEPEESLPEDDTDLLMEATGSTLPEASEEIPEELQEMEEPQEALDEPTELEPEPELALEEDSEHVSEASLELSPDSAPAEPEIEAPELPLPSEPTAPTAEEPLDDDSALFRQETFESVTVAPTAAEPEPAPEEAQPEEKAIAPNPDDEEGRLPL